MSSWLPIPKRSSSKASPRQSKATRPREKQSILPKVPKNHNGSKVIPGTHDAKFESAREIHE